MNKRSCYYLFIMKKIFLWVSVILFLAVLIFTLWTKLFYVKVSVHLEPKQPMVETGFGVSVTSPRPEEVITSPLKISGYVNGDGWMGFEGQVGTVTLVDEKNEKLAQTFLPASKDWMKLPTYFETTLSFLKPKTATGTLIFRNENASGEPSKDKTYNLPVRFR